MIRFPSRTALRNCVLSITVATGSAVLLPGVPLLLVGASCAHAQAVYLSPNAAANAFTISVNVGFVVVMIAPRFRGRRVPSP